MSTATLKRHLIHTCTVQRNTPATSTSGEPVPSWADVATSVRCRYVQKQQDIANERESLQAARVDLLMFLPDADVQKEDRITEIALYADGSSVDAGPFEINELLVRNARSAHHQSATLKRIE